MRIKLIILITTLLIITGCSSFEEAGKILRNERVKTTDDFLIQKRKPLTIPPDMDKVPKPGTLSNNEQSTSEDEIKDLLGKIEETDSQNTSSPSSTEKSILDKIR